MYKDLLTNRKDVKVHVTGYDKPDKFGGYWLRGYAIDKDGNRIDGCGEKRRHAKNAKKLVTTERRLKAAVVAALPDKARRETGGNSELDPSNAIVATFLDMVNSGQKVCQKWNDDTEKKLLALFRHQVLPFLANFEVDVFTSEDRSKLEKELYQNTIGNGRSKGNNQTVINTVRGNLQSASKIYLEMRRRNPTLPDIDLQPVRTKQVVTEQQKSLPRDVRSAFAGALRGMVNTAPERVLGAVLMWGAGLRTAEAAAVIHDKDIAVVSDILTVVQVRWQEKDGIRSPVLKTNDAYRNVPLDCWTREMVAICNAEIKEKPENAFASPIKADELSAWVKSQLIRSGCSAAYIAKAEEDERLYPDKDADGRIIYDVTAYILRRDAASIWRNICGLTNEDCDALLGHSNHEKKKKKVDYRIESVLTSIAVQMERFVRDPEFCMHPGVSPIKLIHGVDLDTIPYETISFINATDRPLKVSVSFLATENGESVSVISDSKLTDTKPQHKNSPMRIKDEKTKQFLPVIGTNKDIFYPKVGGDDDG